MPRRFLNRRFACGGICLVVFAVFQLFASIPELHNWIHADSREATHQCELTLLTQGQVHVASDSIAVVGFVSLVLPAPTPISAEIVLSDYHQLPPGRAPPAA